LPLDDGLEGRSFVPLLSNPDRQWKSSAFSQFRRVIPGYGKVARGMGYSMRTDRYRFTEWTVPGTEFHAFELYDHQLDPNENINLAVETDHQPLVGRLRKQLHAGWKSAGP
jgi:hypothetical protein